jgi:hypothetical protein
VAPAGAGERYPRGPAPGAAIPWRKPPITAAMMERNDNRGGIAPAVSFRAVGVRKKGRRGALGPGAPAGPSAPDPKLLDLIRQRHHAEGRKVAC